MKKVEHFETILPEILIMPIFFCVQFSFAVPVYATKNLNDSVIGNLWPTLSYCGYSGPCLIRPPYLPRNCGHIREVAFGERENYID